MVWLQVSWQVLLFGAELAHATTLVGKGTPPKDVAYRLNPAQREALALGLMQKVAQRFQAGGEPWSGASTGQGVDGAQKRGVAGGGRPGLGRAFGRA